MRTSRKSQWAMLTLIVGALLAGGCRQSSEDSAVENDGGKQILPLPPLPVAEPPMDRAAILLAVARAASAAALGDNDATEQRKLDGKLFEVRIRFGCMGSTREGEAGKRFDVKYDEGSRTLRLRASPDLSLEDEPVVKLAGDKVEAAEGFWIERPWLLADGCPAAPETLHEETRPPGTGSTEDAEPASMPPPGRRVGIAQFFTSSDARTRRRDRRAYEATKVLGDNQQPSTQGYNIVFAGRLRTQPIGRVISCPIVSLDAPPQCIVSVQFDRVWIEAPGSKELLAEWGS
jgi:hypothetical protein